MPRSSCSSVITSTTRIARLVVAAEDGRAALRQHRRGRRPRARRPRRSSGSNGSAPRACRRAGWCFSAISRSAITGFLSFSASMVICAAVGDRAGPMRRQQHQLEAVRNLVDAILDGHARHASTPLVPGGLTWETKCGASKPATRRDLVAPSCMKRWANQARVPSFDGGMRVILSPPRSAYSHLLFEYVGGPERKASVKSGHGEPVRCAPHCRKIANRLNVLLKVTCQAAPCRLRPSSLRLSEKPLQALLGARGLKG